MLFSEVRLPGVFEIQVEPHVDERGFFARTWCQQEFEARGLSPKLVQSSISMNTRKGTLRGLHFQANPFEEAKLVRCTRGAVYDVVVDLRPASPRFCDWFAAVLTAASHKALYIPEGCAHGFMTLENDSEVLYQISEFYHPESARGVRWNDPTFGIRWPEKVEVISERDRTYPDFKP